MVRPSSPRTFLLANTPIQDQLLINISEYRKLFLFKSVFRLLNAQCCVLMGRRVGESGRRQHIPGAAALLAWAPRPSWPKQSWPRTRTWAKPLSPALPGVGADAHQTSPDLPNRHRESEASATPTYLGHGGGGHSPRPRVPAHYTLPRALAEVEATSGAEAGRAGKGGMACGFRRSIACQVLSGAASRREPGLEGAA